jgi:hypothetical protein
MNSSNEFFKVQENDSKYNDICNIGKRNGKGPRENTNVITAFSEGLQCKEPELYQWNSQRKEYIDHFKKAKQCLQRRITTMKNYEAKTPAQKKARKTHIYPIKVAYAYGKDCLKKITSKRKQKVFENSVDKLISDIATDKPNIKTHLGNSIEKSIRDRGARNSIREILNKTYYDPEQMNIINKERNVGYLALNDNSRDKYNSLFDEGFSRNVQLARYLEEASKNEANAYSASVAEEEANENTSRRPSIKTMRHRAAKRKTAKKAATSPRRLNLRNLDTILKNERFAITDTHKEETFKKAIAKLEKLYQQSYLLTLKLQMLNMILNIISPDEFIYTYATNIISKINTSKKPTLKSIKTIRPELTNPKYIAFDNRQVVIRDINSIMDSLERRLEIIKQQIKTAQKTGVKTIDDKIRDFLENYIDETLLYSVDDTIAKLTNVQQAEISSNIAAVNKALTEMKTINNELLTKTDELNTILSNLGTAKRLVILFANNPDRLVRAKEEEAKYKEAYDALETVYIIQYNRLTAKTGDTTTMVSRVYDSPQLLVEFLEDKIITKRASQSLMALSALLAGPARL